MEAWKSMIYLGENCWKLMPHVQTIQDKTGNSLFAEMHKNGNIGIKSLHVGIVKNM